MQIDHVAIAVRSIDRAADRIEALLGYTRRTSKVTNTRQKVTVLFMSKSGSLDIKLIEPAGSDSPLWSFVGKREGLHHICFKVPDVTAACNALVEKGARLLADPAPGEAFAGHPIAFCYLGMGLSVELIDTDEREQTI